MSLEKYLTDVMLGDSALVDDRIYTAQLTEDAKIQEKQVLIEGYFRELSIFEESLLHLCDELNLAPPEKEAAIIDVIRIYLDYLITTVKSLKELKVEIPAVTYGVIFKVSALSNLSKPKSGYVNPASLPAGLPANDILAA